MKILLLAPNPFYQERGTPIAIDLLVKVLSHTHDIDILTFHEGQNRSYKGRVTIHRIKPFFKVNNIRPGFSLKKIYCDIHLLFRMLLMLKKGKYDLIHAVEEAAMLAMISRFIHKTPYVYDMDSIISKQLIEKNRHFNIIKPLADFIEKMTIKKSHGVIAVCQSICDHAKQYKQEHVYLLSDVSMLNYTNDSSQYDDLNNFAGSKKSIGLYIGNLEHYQGIDLLLEALQQYYLHDNKLVVIIIGGNESDIKAYRAKSVQLKIDKNVLFLGPRPLKHMADYIKQANILFSPRITGSNTPMKIYSYLASGIPIIATDLPTHTQVMDESIAFLSQANAKDFAKTINYVIENPDIAKKVADTAVLRAQKQHSYAAFSNRLNAIYTDLDNLRVAKL